MNRELENCTSWGGMGMSAALTVGVVSWVCTAIKIHQSAHVEYVPLTVREPDHNKGVFKKRKRQKLKAPQSC